MQNTNQDQKLNINSIENQAQNKILDSAQKAEIIKELKLLTKQIRYQILVSSTTAGTGHPTSSLSATDLMTTLMFGGFFATDLDNPKDTTNDRLIFSKGHASPLFYALYATAGKLSMDELKTFRQFESRLEGHPSVRYEFTEAPTGSLGQGLGIGLGMAMAGQMDGLNYKTWVLLGDGEMAEGSVWEAIMLAGFRRTPNLVAVVDMNRLGQRGQTMNGHDTARLHSQVASFGWEVLVVENGNDVEEIFEAYQKAVASQLPVMIIAKTLKGAGVKYLEDKDGWHGKTLSKGELEKVLFELGYTNAGLETKTEPILVGKVAKRFANTSLDEELNKVKESN